MPSTPPAAIFDTQACSTTVRSFDITAMEPVTMKSIAGDNIESVPSSQRKNASTGADPQGGTAEHTKGRLKPAAKTAAETEALSPQRLIDDCEALLKELRSLSIRR